VPPPYVTLEIFLSGLAFLTMGSDTKMLEPISGEELGTTRHRPVVTAATPNNGESTSSRERETKCFHCEWRPLDLDAFLVT